jgi:O-antigen/teichoic acid export membrane protein
LLLPFDNILIGHLLGPPTVAQYAVVQKLIGLAYMAPTVILTPLWPAYGEALSRGDVDWVRLTFRKALFFSALTSSIIAVGLIAFGKQLVLLWVGRTIVVPLSIMVPLAVLMVVATIGDATATLLFSANATRYGFLSVSAYTIIGVAAKIWSTPRFGVPGLAWSAALTCCLLYVIPNLLYARRAVLLASRRAFTTMPIPEQDLNVAAATD